MLARWSGLLCLSLSVSEIWTVSTGLLQNLSGAFAHRLGTVGLRLAIGYLALARLEAPLLRQPALGVHDFALVRA
eukprot:3905077-Lingulodinium_polyedra.AAC.1